MNNQVEKWNADLMFPRDSDYINRVVSAEFGPSKSSGNPMLTLGFELVSPQEKEIAGKMISLAGIKTKRYFTLLSTEDDGSTNEEKTATIRKNFVEMCRDKFGITETLDLENLNADLFLGKLLYCQMSANIAEQRKDATISQIATAKAKGVRPEGDIMKHPVTGKNLIKYWPQVDEIFGLAPSDK